jgi:predicted Na+-dependent transporter
MSAGATNELLARAGRSGPALLCGGVLIGLIASPLAEMAKPLMGIAVFVFTLGAFLKVNGASFRAECADRRSTIMILAWATFGVPLLVDTLVQVAHPGPDLALGLLLCALAPPVGSAAAIAAMLGLSAPLALLATVVATLAAPLYLPPLAAAMGGAELAIDPLAMSLRLGAIIGGAALAAWLLRRFAGRWVADNPNAMTGIAVLGLLLVAIGAMRGMREQILTAPEQAALLLALAFLANAGFQAVGALLFAALERRRALTVGLVSGNRNIALVWAAAAPFLADHPAVELFLAMSVFPIFMLPAATQRVFATLLSVAGAGALAPVPAALPGRDRQGLCGRSAGAGVLR